MIKIHPTAILAEDVIIEDGVNVGPYSVIGSNVVLKSNVNLISHVTIQKNTLINEGTTVFPFVTIGFVPQDLKFSNEETKVVIGKNTTIREHCSIHLATKNNPTLTTTIGDNCLLMAGSHVAHDCYVGNNVILANNVLLGGHVEIGSYAIIGGGVPVHQFCRVGEMAIIGGFSGVTEDILPYAIYEGVRKNGIIYGANIIGLKRKGFTADKIKNIKEAYDILFSNTNGNLLLSERINRLQEKFSTTPEITPIINFVTTLKHKNLHVRYKANQ